MRLIIIITRMYAIINEDGDEWGEKWGRDSGDSTENVFLNRSDDSSLLIIHGYQGRTNDNYSAILQGDKVKGFDKICILFHQRGDEIDDTKNNIIKTGIQYAFIRDYSENSEDEIRNKIYSLAHKCCQNRNDGWHEEFDDLWNSCDQQSPLNKALIELHGNLSKYSIKEYNQIRDKILEKLQLGI